VSAAPAVYQSIVDVMGELAVKGIEKGRKNKEQGFAFRGIDDVFNALAPLLAKHRLCILPRYTSRAVDVRTTQRGNPLFTVVVKGELDIVSAVDGSKHTVELYGEAMDTADKATNKAMSAGYKYCALQVFCVPTEGVHDDADATTPEPEAAKPAGKPMTKAQRRDIHRIATEHGKDLDDTAVNYALGVLKKGCDEEHAEKVIGRLIDKLGVLGVEFFREADHQITGDAIPHPAEEEVVF
jgi:hypothetical protein